jgi:hypothetical protein
MKLETFCGLAAIASAMAGALVMAIVETRPATAWLLATSWFMGSSWFARGTFQGLDHVSVRDKLVSRRRVNGGPGPL